jgi:hypothetical protein
MKRESRHGGAARRSAEQIITKPHQVAGKFLIQKIAEPGPARASETAVPTPDEGRDGTALPRSGITVFVNHVSDVEALYKRPMTKNDGEWVYAVDRVARSAADYAIGVDLLSRLHWQSQDKTAIKSYLDYIRQMLTYDIRTLDGAVNNSELAVIREGARSLRDDIRAFDGFIASMTGTVSLLPAPATLPGAHTDSGQNPDSF